MGKSLSRRNRTELIRVLPSEHSSQPLNTSTPHIPSSNTNRTPPTNVNAATPTNVNTTEQFNLNNNQTSLNNSPRPPSATVGEPEQMMTRDSNTLSAASNGPEATRLRFEFTSESCRILSEKYFITTEEVEVLWRKFTQFELNSNNNANIDTAMTSFQNPFAKNIFKRIALMDDNLVTFESYVQYLSKWKNATNALKIQLIFEILGNGNSLQPSLIKALSGLIYPEMSETDRNELAQNIVDTVDSKDSNCIDLMDFIEYFNQDFMQDFLRQHLHVTFTENAH